MAKQEVKHVKAATKTASKSVASRTKKVGVKWLFPMTKSNLIFIGISLGVILLGYGLMATGITEQGAAVDGKWNNPLAISVAPILLVLGYCVMIPIGIIRIFHNEHQTDEAK